MDDLDAFIALKKGDKLAFRHLFEKYYNRLVAYIVTYTHDKAEAEDIVQQAFIDFWNDRLKLDETKRPRAYLYTIAYHRYIDAVKKVKKQERILVEIWESALRDTIHEDNEILEKRIQKLRQVIDTLPPKCREIIRMNKVQGIKYREIAIQMGISVKTVETQMRIAFRKIREAFNDHDLFLLLICPMRTLRM